MHAEHNDNNDKWHSLLEKYTSHFIWRGCVWERVGDQTELQHIDPDSYGHQRFFPVLQGCSTRGLGAQLSTGCWLSLPHFVSKLSDLQTFNRGSRGPLLLGAVFLYRIFSTNWLNFLCTQLYNSSMSTLLEWHVLIVIEWK